MLATIAGLAAITILVKGAGALLPDLRPAIADRLAGLAPALLAALVYVELAGADDVPRLGAKAVGVAVAVIAVARRLPFAVCVVAGAAVAGALRATGVLG